jgi:hypothetical protein
MLPRFLVVIGMTVGVMAPLVWAAYVLVPAFRALPTRAGDWSQAVTIGTALRETPKPQSTSRSTPTMPSIETTAAAVPDRPPPKSDLKSVTAPPSVEPEPEQLAKPVLPQVYDANANQASHASKEAKPAPIEDVTSTVSIAPAPDKALQGKTPQGARDAAPLRDGPVVVDIYNGAHIIVVCSELPRLMGCP